MRRAWVLRDTPRLNQNRFLIGVGVSFSTTNFTAAEQKRYQQRLQPDYAASFQAVKSSKRLRLLQTRIREDGLHNDPILKSLLIQMYGRCGSVREARLLFDSMSQRPMLSWKSIIRGYVQAGDYLEALQLAQQLLQEGFIFDKYTSVSILTACANRNDFPSGCRIHAVVVGNGFVSDIAIGTSLVNMYGKCDNVDLCVEIFESMQARHVIAWNVLIATHVKHDHQDVAIFFFHQMQEEGVLPNRITFISVLPGAAQSASYQMVKEVHAIYSTPEFQQDATLGNALLNTYCSLGNICEALVVFDGLSTQNLVSWTTIIGAYTQQRLCREASQSFEQMHQQGLLADQVTYISILETVATSKAFLEGKKLHVRLTCTNGLGSDEVISTALLRMYGSCDSVVQAFIIFDNMPHHSLLSWTSIIALQSHLMGGRYALQSFAQMLQEGFLPDKVVLFSLLNVFCSLANVQEGKQLHSLLIGAGHRLDDTAGANLVNLYLNSSSLEETRKLFHSISDMGVASWTAMINVCLKHHQNQDALQLFNQMLQEGILPSAMALTALLRACSSLSSLYNGVRANIYIRLGLLDADENSLIASLINMYGKCGDLRAALRIFYGNLNQNISTCTALLAVYVHHGESMKALQVCQMLTDKGFMLDGSVFLQVFLACSRSGLVTEAYESFVNLLRLHPSKLGLEHFCCMVDLCSRAEHVQDAEVFMHTMPCQPSAAIWMTLLWACRQHVDIGKAELVASYIAELNQSEGGHYVVLSNIYALAGRCDDYP